MNILEELLHAQEPWVVYRSLIDLAGLPEQDPQVLAAKARLLEHPLVKSLVDELQTWPGQVLNSHKSAGQLYHKLEFLADLGLKKDDADFSGLIEKLSSHRSEEGLFQLNTNIPVHFGGTGQDQMAWALCDAPLLLYAAARMNLAPEDEIARGRAFLLGLVRENGWPCKVSKELGNFRGPGRKEDPCPYANLIMLKLLSAFPEHQESRETRIGAECLLGLWENSREKHPFMFFMGTDFRKLKAPFIWYDILHVAEVLTRFRFILQDKRLHDMVSVINAKADGDGLFTAESQWKAWQDWDFGQKKKPSPWLKFCVCRINQRLKV